MKPFQLLLPYQWLSVLLNLPPGPHGHLQHPLRCGNVYCPHLKIAGFTFFVWIIFSIFGYPTCTYAGAISVGALKDKAVKEKLYEDAEWRNLLYYKETGFRNEKKSEVHAAGFFISPAGMKDPEKEMLATVEALFMPADMGDNHPQCLFPARTLWLKEKLDIDEADAPHPECRALMDFRQQFAPTEVTVVLPVSYLNNPSSAFGHAFLKFESGSNSHSSGLMAYTMSFAAKTSSFRGTLDYAYRGVMGGFPCDTSINRYYRMIKQYSHIENRDTWEYKLNLTPQELERLILHVWEIKDKNVFDYYFFGENCAYRVLALLDVARPELGLRSQFTAYTIPAEVVRALRERGAIERTFYVPSALKTALRHARELNETEKQWVREVVVEKVSLEARDIDSVPAERVFTVLGVASQYLAILIDTDTVNRKDSAELERKIFLQRLQSPIGKKAGESAVFPVASPDQGHKGRRLYVGIGGDAQSDFVAVGFRQAYHGLLDPLSGFEKGTELELLSGVLKAYKNGDIKLEKLDILNTASYFPISTFYRPLSWRYRIGREQREFDRRRPVNYAEGKWGLTGALGELNVSGLLGLSLENSAKLRNGWGIGGTAALELLQQSERVSSRVEVLSEGYIIGQASGSVKVSAHVGIPIKNDVGVVLGSTGTYSYGKYYYESTAAATLFF